jgi:hypothetical protein
MHLTEKKIQIEFGSPNIPIKMPSPERLNVNAIGDKECLNLAQKHPIIINN